jgi:Domain of unknown function (DUF6602)
MPELRQIDLSPFLGEDANRLLRARQDASHLHASGDIRAAGNQVEVPAREMFRRRLSARYRVTHGHATDYRGFVTPQSDIIIADAFSAPALLQAEDGTEYVPYESVFALGEVKSTFYRGQRPIEKAITTIHDIRTGLARPPTKRNPLFYFLLFVDSGDLRLDDVANLYKSTPVEDLPNIACWLDHGTILYSKVGKNGLGEWMPINYLLSPHLDRNPAEEYAWSLIQWGYTEDRRAGSHLAALIGILSQHLESCVLEPPNLQREIAFLGSARFQLLM